MRKITLSQVVSCLIISSIVDQQGYDQPPFDDEDDESEDDYDLRDVSSDVEIDPNELDIPSDDEE